MKRPLLITCVIIMGVALSSCSSSNSGGKRSSSVVGIEKVVLASLADGTDLRGGNTFGYAVNKTADGIEIAHTQTPAYGIVRTILFSANKPSDFKK